MVLTNKTICMVGMELQCMRRSLSSNWLVKNKKSRSACNSPVQSVKKMLTETRRLFSAHNTNSGHMLPGKSEYKKLMDKDDDVPWYCIPCLVIENSRIFPFTFYLKLNYVI